MANATHCAICGERPTAANPLTRGHIIAITDGGTNHPGNYRAECARCNYGGRGRLENLYVEKRGGHPAVPREKNRFGVV